MCNPTNPMSETDPFADRKKNVERAAATRNLDDQNRNVLDKSPQDDVNSVRSQTTMPGNQRPQLKEDGDEDTELTDNM
jgi:hypothetical protein